jgi:AAA+ ATPase superfamily predicted ATPase
LYRHLNSNKAEFIAVYGRRRVGKTFLINEVFRENMVFRHTGISPYNRKRKSALKDQLLNFYFSLIRHGMEGISQPKSWMEAFFLLEQHLERIYNGSRQVVFIDELPWMDTPRSGFLTALEAFWNGWCNSRQNLCLVVCGSATSWMIDNLINNKGGLYGRLTCEMKLHPFTLHECEDFFH